MTTETQSPFQLVGTQAPTFTTDAVSNGEFKEISLSDFKGKWKVLFFYPLDFTFVCPTEITAFSDAIASFKALNCEVMACSTDSKFSHLAWTKQSRNEGGLGEISYPILADFDKSIASNYGVLMDAGMALRGLFIIDANDNIQHSTINNLGVGRSVDEVLRLVEAFQFVEKNGEVCPAGWTKGNATMKPDPKGSQAYFNKL